MKLIVDRKISVPVTKAKKPSFKNIIGRTWKMGHVIINGHKTRVFFDSTRGRNLYFQDFIVETKPHKYYHQWYKFPMHNSIGDGLGSFDIDPLSTKPVELTIKK